MKIPFNRPYTTGRELSYIQSAIERGNLSSGGEYTEKCEKWLEEKIQCARAFLTHSCTGALEMAALLADLQPGDEIIFPSFTYVTTVNAFVLRGAVPVFVDIRSDTLNIDESLIEAAITTRTRAIVPVHYAGVSSEMDAILPLAEKHRLIVIEDAAMGIYSQYKRRPLGSLGQMGAISFHETKNIHSGSGGALLLNDESLVRRGEIIREKGTDRAMFFRGEVDKYSWVDLGSSYLPSEIAAAFLWAQMEEGEAITGRRLEIWQRYHDGLQDLEEEGKIRRPVIPPHCIHNGHMYYVLLENASARGELIHRLREKGIHAVFHYVPLHSSPAGRKYGRSHGELPVTERVSSGLLRLPLWPGVEDTLDYILVQLHEQINSL